MPGKFCTSVNETNWYRIYRVLRTDSRAGTAYFATDFNLDEAIKRGLRESPLANLAISSSAKGAGKTLSGPFEGQIPASLPGNAGMIPKFYVSY